VALALAACGSESSTSAQQAASGGDASDLGDAYVGCTDDPRVAVYAPGVAVQSQDQRIRVVLVAGNPAPPIVGMNTWTVAVEGPGDAAVPDAALAVAPYMPDHGHGSPLPANATPNGDGTYSIAPLYFFMPGVWRIQITVATSDAGPPSTVDFFFCIGG
jgi:hypothetical protein